MRHLYFTFLLFWSCQDSPKKIVATETNTISESIADLAPIMLDDIHYYTLDRVACNQFFENNFYTRPMVEESPNPFEFIDFQLVRPQQSTINISNQGSFPGIKVGNPKRWERQLIKPSPENSYRYGVHWVAFGTKNLVKSKITLQKNGITIIDEDFRLPHSNSKSILCYGPDYNLIVVTEDQNDNGKTPYFIDHLMLLVNDLEANKKFYTDVFQAKEITKGEHYSVLNIANHTFILAKPEALNLDRSAIIERDLSVFKPDVDHLGFLFKEIQPAYDNALSKGYKFLSKPIKINYYNKPTLYTFAITYSPDGLQCELFKETGRTASRTNFKK